MNIAPLSAANDSALSNQNMFASFFKLLPSSAPQPTPVAGKSIAINNADPGNILNGQYTANVVDLRNNTNLAGAFEITPLLGDNQAFKNENFKDLNIALKALVKHMQNVESASPSAPQESVHAATIHQIDKTPDTDEWIFVRPT